MKSFLSTIPKYAEDIWPFFTAQILVRVFYFFLLYSSIILFQQWDYSLGLKSQISFIPPIAWIPLVGFPAALAIVKISFITISLLASLVPQWRWVRILAFVAVLEYVSLYYSVLYLDVDWYTFILTAFFLIFLPDNWGKPLEIPKIERQKFLLVFWGVQAINLLTYTMSGIGKVLAFINQVIVKEVNILEPQASALITADRLITTHRNTPLGGFIIDNYFLVWPFFLATIYLLIVSIFIAFKPSLHRLWGLGLILFHINNYLVIDIGFNAHIFLAALLFLLSPFAPRTFQLKQTLHDLPMFGTFIKLIIK